MSEAKISDGSEKSKSQFFERYRYTFAAILTLVGIVAVWLLWNPPDSVRAKYNLISRDMTREDVIAIMGEPTVAKEAYDGEALFYETRGAMATIVVSPKDGMVLTKTWDVRGPVPEWLIFWRAMTGQ